MMYIHLIIVEVSDTYSCEIKCSHDVSESGPFQYVIIQINQVFISLFSFLISKLNKER